MTENPENPGAAVEEAVRRSLALVDTWLHWDGRPHVSEDGDRVYTPHKAVRRIADHLTGVLRYAEQVGDLTPRQLSCPWTLVTP
ncbi:MAG TPA: hypothetical protein VFJ89_04740 [Nocardioides sp.]|nr:hypothetical protein [Nocardioides sp.]